MSKHTINSLQSLASIITIIDEEWHKDHFLEIKIVRRAKQRTLTQNKALHLFLAQLAEVLNDAGYDMRRTLKHDAEIPWTPENAKLFLWKPIQKALTQKTSTTEISTAEPTQIHDVLCRHLGSKLGVVCPPWPRKLEK